MIYEFAAKIKNIKSEIYDAEFLAAHILETDKKFEKPLVIKTLTPNIVSSKEMLVKSQESVSTIQMFHETELNDAIRKFKEYLEDISAAVNGEISKEDGFYNNTKTFSRLFF